MQTVKAFLRKYPSVITGGMAIVAILVAMIIGGILIALMGINPIEAYGYFFHGVFGSTYAFGETVNKFTPLVCCALSFSIAVKSGFCNLGAEGQIYAGALASVLVASQLDGVPAIFAITLSIAAGMLGGILLSGIAGVLRIRFKANELLSTLMLNYIMQYTVALLVSGVLKNPDGSMEQTAVIPTVTQLPSLLSGSRLHAGVIIALAALLLVAFLRQRMVAGYEMRLSGINPKAARYAGVNQRRSLILVILISGALAGLAGSLELLGNQYKLMSGLPSGYGFDGIGIAVMGRHSTAGIFLSAFLFAAIRTGTSSMQRGIGVPTPMLYILQGVIVIAVFISNYYVDRIKEALVEGRG